MDLLVYSTAAEGVVKRVRAALESSVPDGTLETYLSPSSLSRRLRQPKDEMTIAVLLIARREDFEDILPLRHLLRGIRVILVLPDTEEKTIAMAHRLRPRYLTYIDGNFLGLSSVVKKMIEGYRET